MGLPGTVIFALLVLAAILAFAYSASRRFQALLAGKRENRFDRLPTRLGKTIEYAFLQLRMFRDPYAGTFHILIFSGFVVLTVRTRRSSSRVSPPRFSRFPARSATATTSSRT